MRNDPAIMMQYALAARDARESAFTYIDDRAMIPLSQYAPDTSRTVLEEISSMIAANPSMCDVVGSLLFSSWDLYLGWADWYEHAEELV